MSAAEAPAVPSHAALPAVTVVVPFLNAENTIGGLTAALRAQKAHPLGGTEFVFVDNGSTDGGRALVEASGLPNLRVLSEPKPGVSAARNRGLGAARGAVVAVTDADCLPVRQWLRELVAPFTAPDVNIVAGGMASYLPRTGAQRFAARYGMNDATRGIRMSAIPFANGRNMAVRREIAQAVGGWPEDMLRGEDIEFSYLISERFRCVITHRPQALVFHQDRASDDELRRQAHGYGWGMALLYARHPDLLPWGWRERARRVRMSARRRVGVATSRLARSVGRGDGESVEFADYLSMWDRSFWRGFQDGRRSVTRR